MSFFRQRGLAMAASSAFLVACGGGGDGGTDGPPAVASVTVTAPAGQLEVGGTVLFAASVKDGKGNVLTGRALTWTSSAQGVATVDNSGVVTGVGAGQATISAASEGVSGTAQVTVIPIPVAAVVISERTPSVRQGETVQLTAIVQDAIGRPLAGRAISWASRNVAVASVGNTGMVTGVTSGTALIVASAEGRADSVSLRVKSLNAPTLTTTTPAVWAPGGAATVTGTNFSAVASENEVLVNGVRGTITGATTTTISFTLPSATQLPCTPTGPVPVAVVVNGDTATATAALQMATPRTLAVGQHLLLTGQTDLLCNEFSVTGGKYLVTAFNYSQSSSNRTSFQLLGAAASAAAGAQAPAAAQPSMALTTAGPLVRNLALLQGEGFARGHLQSLELNRKLMERNPALRRALVDRRARARRGALSVSPTAREVFASMAVGSVPVDPPAVGEKLWKRMPKTFGNYTTFDSMRVRVVYVGPKLIIMEDSLNEFFGTMDAEYQALGAQFDAEMWPLLTNFGDPLAIDDLTDNNGRVIAIFSKRVNEYQLNNGGQLLGYVTLCDFFAQEDPDPDNVCVPSNEGEYFYAIAPNPNGARGKYDLAGWKRYARGTMIHELKHVVMFVQRIFLDASFTEETWLEEATAQVASELWARKHYGSFGPRSDLRWDQGPNCDYATMSAGCPDPVEAILHPFQFLYSHYNANESKSFINNSDIVIYGSAWSFARWATDTYGGADEGAFLRSLVQQRDDRGITNILNRTGRTWAELLGLFSMASAADNYPGGTVTDPRLRLASWNTRDVFAGMNANLVFRNQDGSTTPAFPRAWPLNVRVSAFGNLTDPVRTVASLPGGGFVAWELGGPQQVPQVLAIRQLNGGLPPATIGMVVLRVQ